MLASELISGVFVFKGNTGKADAVSLSGYTTKIRASWILGVNKFIVG